MPFTPDSRVQSRFETLNGIKYHYLLGTPADPNGKTVFTFHGWPDLSVAWRHQVSMLLDLGYQTVSPDLIGYGDTESPRTSPDNHLDDDKDLNKYTFKRAADDMAELASKLGLNSVLSFGHDWGAMVAYRFALWHPELVKGVVAVCVPFIPPAPVFYSPEQVAKMLPNFGYQIYNAGPELETRLKTKDDFKAFFNGIFGGKIEGGKLMEVTKGFNLDLLEGPVGPSPLQPPEVIDLYAEKYAKDGMHGPQNWYRTRKLNFDDERPLLPDRAKISVPTLFIAATQDAALPPAMSEGMEKWFTGPFRREQVDATHWALWQAKDDVNKHIKTWLDETFSGSKL